MVGIMIMVAQVVGKESNVTVRIFSDRYVLVEETW